MVEAHLDGRLFATNAVAVKLWQAASFLAKWQKKASYTTF